MLSVLITICLIVGFFSLAQLLLRIFGGALYLVFIMLILPLMFIILLVIALPLLFGMTFLGLLALLF